MKLRTRILIGFTMIFVVVIAAGVFTVTAQRNQLYDQIDDRLTATPLPPETRARQPAGDATTDGGEPQGTLPIVSRRSHSTTRASPTSMSLCSHPTGVFDR